MHGPRRNLRPFTIVALAAVCTGLFGLSAFGQSQDFGAKFDLFGDGKKDSAEPSKPAGPDVRVTLIPSTAKPGDEVALSVRVGVPKGAHTYSISPSFGGGSRINITAVTGLEPLEEGFTANPAPIKVYVKEFEQEVEEHESDVTWSRKYRVLPNAAATGVSITGKLNYQVCDDHGCTPYRVPIKVALELSPVTPPPVATQPASVRPSASLHQFEAKPKIRGTGTPVTVRARLTPETAKPGEEVALAVTLELESPWHTYSTTQPPGQSAVPTKIELTSLNGLKPVDGVWKPSRPFQPHMVQDGPNTYLQEIYTETVTWTTRLIVEPSAAVQSFGVAGKVNYQVCNEKVCLQPQSVVFSLGAANAQDLPTVNAPQPAAASADTASVESSGADDGQKEGLVPFIAAAMLAGFLALLTPCVFPMVPITVSFFLKQSESEHHRPVWMALVYCAGIVVTFTVLGLAIAITFRATALNEFANNPWLNLVIAGVLIFFGMNLLGLFEIRMPGWLLTWSSQGQGRGGIVGTLFMALTFTLVSFTCTFAFVGGLLVWAANGEYYRPIVGMLAFSSAFALPFFFLALFPSFLHKLPKSGGWMNRVKVTMGMIECGAAFKFLSVADLSLNPVPMFFDYALVMSAWMVLAICTGLYLLGLFRTAHDTPSESVGVFRLASAMTFFGLAAYLAVGLFGSREPEGKVWQQIAAFAPPRFEGHQTELGPTLEMDGLKFALDYDLAVKYAQEKKTPLFLDFTGVNCVNCRRMERIMQAPQNRKQLEKFVLVQLYTDNVPSITDETLVEAILAKNRDLQEIWFQDTTLPAYAVVTPDGKTVLAKFRGFESRDGAFTEFLEDGTRSWQKFQLAGNGSPLASR